MERVVLVAVGGKHQDGWTVESSLDELGQLVATAGGEVVGRVIQHLSHPSPESYLGKGKLQELQARQGEIGYNTVIFDDELSPRQQSSLEEILKVKVLDRTALILDIFAQRARTREAELQVKLAQHVYLLPRLAGQWSHLERLGGGIGTRGPGEAQIETDRRLIRDRIARLRRELEDVRRQRALYRTKRQETGVPVVALVGYTNAGKSTLFNALTRAEVFVENKLFATLDPTTRQLKLPGGKKALLTDTVGFIRKLPPTVVAAFRATLEELEEAHLLLNVVDITHPSAPQQNQTVEKTLEELGLAGKPRLLVLNKVDLLAGPRDDLEDWAREDTVLVSATQGRGLDRLLELVAQKLQPQPPVHFL